MNIILIPGFWLDGTSWSSVRPELTAAGHAVHAVTLPGKRRLGQAGGGSAVRGIGLHDQVDAVVGLLDSLAAPVVLVGHSAGASIAWAAADARPSRIARVVFVDALPFPAGSVINDQLPVIDEGIPLPEWSFFEPEDLVDLDEGHRERMRATGVIEPAAVATDPQVLVDEARFAVPVTVVACGFPEAMLREAMTSGAPWASELTQLEQLDIVELPTGHWPQFTRPTELAQSMLTAMSRG